MKLRFENKVILITGTNNPKGIGAAIARKFANANAKLVLVYKRLDYSWDEAKANEPGYDLYFKSLASDGGEVKDELEGAGAKILTIEADITDKDAPAKIFKQAVKKFGHVDFLINNAAEFSEHDSLDKITPEAIDLIFDVNTKATLLMSQLYLQNFQGQSGRIINFSTDSAQNMAGQIAYGASKAANESVTRSLAVELGSKGITVNCIAPGPTQTGWINKDLETIVLPDIPTGRLVQPEDIADAVAFLCSDEANQITGQIIKVSGGHNI